MSTVTTFPSATAFEPRLDALARGLDFLLLYFILFTASGAVYRYGAINTYLWYAVYLWVIARLGFDIPNLLRAIIRNWPVLVWPALAIASVAWSLAPGASLRGGLQLLMTTIVALFIGSRFTMRELLSAFIVILSLAAIASLAILFLHPGGYFSDVGGFEGVFAHKNTLGLRMNMLIGSALVLFAGTRWKIPLIGVLLIAAYLLVLSKSATSQILGLATPVFLIAIAALAQEGKRAAFSVCAATLLLAAGALTMFIANADPVSAALDRFGKDSTLTGRTWLWERGIQSIAEHPWIGGGYQAFWAYERSTDVLWIRHITLESVKGFHNVGVEVWNDLGIPGFAALIGVLIWYASRAFRSFRSAPSAGGLFAVFFFVIVIVSGSVNNSFFRQHELVHVMLCALFAANAPVIAARTAPYPRPARTVRRQSAVRLFG